MTRVIDPQGKALIGNFEGSRLTAYKDEGGVWTVGRGHTGPDVTPYMVITQEHEDALFDSDISTASRAVEFYVKVALNDNQFAALVSLVFNIGASAFGASTLVRLLNGGDYSAVPTQILRWDKISVGGQFVSSPGLARRRRAEAALWLSPCENELPLPPPVSVTPVEPAQKPLHKTKTVIGAVTGMVGGLLDSLLGTDFSGMGAQLGGYTDLGSYVKYLALAMTVMGFGLAIYGRLRVRRDTGA